MAETCELLPAIDLRQGRVVRLAKGDDERRTVYDEEPEAVLARYREAGVARVHVVDLDAALGEPAQMELRTCLLDAARQAGGPKIQWGGGLRDEPSVRAALEAGCDRVVVGSMVTRDFGLFARLARENPGKLVPALDVREGEVRIAGWTESAEEGLEELCGKLRGLPCPAVLVTDVERDGMMGGPNLEIARRVGRLSGLPALVSGGVRSLDDLRAAREAPEVGGVVVGKALYEGAFTLEEAVACFTSSAPATAPHPLAPSPRGRGEGEKDENLSRLACRVIPCLDVSAGRVVKGIQFRDLVDQGDPAECALRYAEQGADEIVFLDITAAPERRGTDLAWVRRTAEQVFVPLTVGGGVRSVEDARELLLAGADKVGVNTAAVERPELLTELARRFGSQCVVLSVDGRRRSPDEGGGWEVVTKGGRHGTGLDLLGWIERGIELGAGEILLTSIDSDGTKSGYDLPLLAAVSSRVSVPVIASGGAGTPDHLASALQAGAQAVLAASIFHQGTYTVGQIKEYLAAEGFPMRFEGEAA